jgi:hypothetical protein
VDAGGTVCVTCARAVGGALPVNPTTIVALTRLRSVAWAQALAGTLGASEGELRTVLDAQLARLAGHGSRATRFLREVSRGLRVSEGT